MRLSDIKLFKVNELRSKALSFIGLALIPIGIGLWSLTWGLISAGLAVLVFAWLLDTLDKPRNL